MLITLVLTCATSSSLAEPAQRHFKFVTQNDLKVLDPFWTTAYLTQPWLHHLRCAVCVRRQAHGAAADG